MDDIIFWGTCCNKESAIDNMVGGAEKEKFIALTPGYDTNQLNSLWRWSLD